MPVHMTPNPPLSKVGPGIPLLTVSDVVFTPGPNSVWQFNWFAQGQGDGKFWQEIVAATSNDLSYKPWTTPQTVEQIFSFWPAPNANVWIQTTINDPNTGITDDGQIGPVPWDPTSGLGSQALHLPTQTGQGGFTVTDRQTLNDTKDTTDQILPILGIPVPTTVPDLVTGIGNMLGGITTTLLGPAGEVAQSIGAFFSGKAFSLLSLKDLGTACFPDILQATAPMGGSAYGMQVQVTQYPDYIAFTGAGDNYTEQSLGTLVISRSGNILLRQGLHYVTEMIYPMPGVPNTPYFLSVPVDPGAYEITIWPAPNVCVAAQLLGFP
jgi:hypothetical protein